MVLQRVDEEKLSFLPFSFSHPISLIVKASLSSINFKCLQSVLSSCVQSRFSR